MVGTHHSTPEMPNPARIRGIGRNNATERPRFKCPDILVTHQLLILCWTKCPISSQRCAALPPPWRLQKPTFRPPPGSVSWRWLERVVQPWHDGRRASNIRTGTRVFQAWRCGKEVVLCQVVVTRIARAGWSNGRVTGGPLSRLPIYRTPGAYLPGGSLFGAWLASTQAASPLGR